MEIYLQTTSHYIATNYYIIRCQNHNATRIDIALTPQILIVHRTPPDRTPYATRSGGGRNLIGRRTQNDDLLQETTHHTIPIIPRIAYRRMVHRHRLHTPAVAQEISARRRAAPVHYYRLAVLPSLARHLVPKALAPNNDIMLADEGLKEYVVCHKLEP